MDQYALNIKTRAFIGGICAGLGLVHYDLQDKSIDREKFFVFCRRLKARMGARPWVMYLDNLKVHTSIDSATFLAEEGIECIWAPLYSPDYNAIEFYFSQMKHWVKRARLNDMLERRKRTYDDYVAEAADKIDNEKVDGVIEHVLKLFKIK